MSLSRRGFLLSLAQSTPPNIVFLLADDLGYADIGCYGQQKIRTPHLDALAKQAMRFTQAYAGGPVCAPSRCVLMTGKHLGHAAIRANAGTSPLPASEVTVATLLKKLGYATGAFGKWGLGDANSSGVPWQHGFDQFYGYLHQVHAHTYFPEFLWDNDKQDKLEKGTYSATHIADRSLAWLREQKSKPFFLYACPTLPHGRFETPTLDPYADTDWPIGEKKYAAMVTQLDAYVGRILKTLDEMGVANNTLFIFASDNGGVSGEGHSTAFFNTMAGVLRGQKGTLYEGGLRVPFLARWPGRIQANTVNQSPLYFADILGLFTQVAKGTVPGIFKNEPSRSRVLYWEDYKYNAKTQALTAGGAALRLGPWKMVNQELYNLVKDPGETRDVAAENPKIAAEMAARMKAAHTPPLPHSGIMEWVK